MLASLPAAMLFATILFWMRVWFQILSMKLALVNPGIDFNLDNIFTTEVSIGFCLSIFL